MAPTRRPMRLPKITKYSVAVTTDGTMVWPQMRMMRPYSRMTMVWKPIQRTTLRLTSGAPAAPRCSSRRTRPQGCRAGGAGRRRGGRSPPALARGPAPLDQLHEDLLQAVHLVAHAQHFDAERRQAREDVVEVLLLRHLDLEGVIVDHSGDVTLQARRGGKWLAYVQHEGLDVQPAQQTAHAITLHDASAVDDGDVAAQALGFLQIVRGENDGGAAIVDLAQELPHRAADLDVDPGGGLIENQQPRLVHQRACDHQAALHAAGQAARHAPAPLPQLQLLEVLLGALARYRARDAVEARLVDHDGVRGLEHVEVQFLRHDADAGLGRLQLVVDVVAEDARLAGGLVDERGDDPDERGLAGAVGSEQREEVAPLDLEVDALERLHAVSVGLGQSAY